MTAIISHDIQSLVLTDKIGESYIVKRKLLWGADGIGNDVTEATPFPVGVSGSFVPPTQADAIQASYPDNVTEVYKYFQGGTSGVLLMTLTVTYTNATKQNVNTVIKT